MGGCACRTGVVPASFTFLESEMKGLVLLFIAVAGFGIAWRYMDKVSKRHIKAVVRENLMPITAAVLTVALAVVFSLNTTLRFF